MKFFGLDPRRIFYSPWLSGTGGLKFFGRAEVARWAVNKASSFTVIQPNSGSERPTSRMYCWADDGKPEWFV